MECLFCQILKEEIPAKVVYRDDVVIAFEDIHPIAPIHLLIVPQKHIGTLNNLMPEDNELIGYMIQTAKMLALEKNISEEGYRLVLNCNAGAGQTIFHIHLHLLGGRQFSWPPG